MQTIRRIPFWGALALLIYMPFHIFLSQWVSTVTGGLDVWKVAKDIILALLVMFTICLVWLKGKGNKLFNLLVLLTVFYTALHFLLWVLRPSLENHSAILGIVYNSRVPGFLLLGLGAGLFIKPKKIDNLLLKIVLAVSTVTAVLGVVQYMLPVDFMTHFGYSLERGVRAAFFIDDNQAFPRIMSTLRDPNSFGAYLIIPISALTYLLLTIRQKSKLLLLAGLILLHCLALYLTFSRSAWIGAVLAIPFVVWWRFKGEIAVLLKRWWPVAICLALAVTGGLFVLRNSSIISHTSSAQVGEFSSNEYHWIYVKKGLEGIWRNPLGHGPGTAGLASIQNKNGGLLTENYFVQIGYEVGVVGLLVFVALSALACVYLWRCPGIWPPVLLGSFLAYIFINMLLHSWSNEAVAAQWWILAGLVVGVRGFPAKNDQ